MPSSPRSGPDRQRTSPYCHLSREDVERQLDQQRERLEQVETAYHRLHALAVLVEVGEGHCDAEVLAWAGDVTLTLLEDLGAAISPPTPETVRPA